MNPSRKRRWVALAAGAVALFLAVAAAAHYFGPDPQLEKVRQLRDQLRSEAGRGLPPEARQERWRQLGEEMKKLTPEQRGELWEDRQREYLKEIDGYFALSRKEQIVHLDHEINRMEAARKRMEAARAEKARSQSPGTGGPGGSKSFGPGPPGRGGWQSLPAEEKERRRKDRLDRRTPEERAKLAEYRKQLEARRLQRGLPPSPRGGR